MAVAADVLFSIMTAPRRLRIATTGQPIVFSFSAVLVAFRLFEPFFSTKAKGHGLGLAIARSLAWAHGGDVTIAPRGDGPGTRAALILPVRQEDEGDT